MVDDLSVKGSDFESVTIPKATTTNKQTLDLYQYILSSRLSIISMSKPLYVTNPEQWLSETAKGPDLLCIVIFRGSWCKYDRHYLRKLGSFHQNNMKKENVRIVAWTSEGAEGAKKADEDWGLTKDFGYDEVIGDETLALAKHLVDDEVLPRLKTASIEDAKLQDVITAGTYPNGIVMPGMIWYAHHGTITLQWECEFDGQSNVGGPGRPDPGHLWEEIKKRKHALDCGNAIMPAHNKEMKLCSNDMDVTLASCSIL